MLTDAVATNCAARAGTSRRTSAVMEIPELSVYCSTPVAVDGGPAPTTRCEGTTGGSDAAVVVASVVAAAMRQASTARATAVLTRVLVT
jgi:hypothetical protein